MSDQSQEDSDRVTCIGFAANMADLLVAAASLKDEHATQENGNHVVGLIQDRWASLTAEEHSMGDRFRDKASAAAGMLNSAAGALESIVPMLGESTYRSNVDSAVASAEGYINEAIGILYST